MATLTKLLSRASKASVEVETLKTIAIFCGAGLFVSLMLVIYGLDLSPGIF